MKNLIFVLIITLICSNLLTANPLGNGDKKCRFDVTNIDATLSLEKQLTNDLLSGIWMKKSTNHSNQEVETSLQFTATGLVSILSQKKEKIENYSHQIWQLNTTNSDLPLLILTNTNTEKMQIYHVEQHCEGLNLIDSETGHITELIYKSNQQNKTLKALNGTWKSMIFPNSVLAQQQNIESAFYEYELKKDGSIKKMLGGENIETIVQTGVWQISPDGQYLILHLQEGTEFKTSIAKINYLALDELALGQAIATCQLEKELCGDMESFYFNKQ